MQTTPTLKDLKDAAYNHLTEAGLKVSYNFVHKIIKKWIVDNPGATVDDVIGFLEQKRDLFSGITYSDNTGKRASIKADRARSASSLAA